MKRTLLIAILLLIPAFAYAQQKEAPVCSVRILLLNQNWDDHSQTRELMSPDQTKWWLEDGQKKFKSFCFVHASKPYDFKLVWTDTDTFRTIYVPSTTTTNGSVEVGGKTATYSEVSHGPGHRQTVRKMWVQIQLFKADAEPDSTPLFIELHKGDWVWSKPDRQALENGLKALSKLINPK